MRNLGLSVFLGVFATVGVSHAQQSDEALIEEALSAAPPVIAAAATVADWENRVLREGTNGYTCLPTPSQLQGTAPMCMDGPWMEWAAAWAGRTEFVVTSTGIAYMLAGDAGASNIDPYAEGETDDNQWVVEGAHLMLIVPDAATLDALPTDPESGGPYVMWKGTPYVHVMVPLD